MEASDHPCDSTEENQSVVTEPSPSSSLPANNNSEEYSDPMGNNSDVLAKGLSTMLSTVIRDFDCRAHETIKSQDQLRFALDRLTRGYFLLSYSLRLVFLLLV